MGWIQVPRLPFTQSRHPSPEVQTQCTSAFFPSAAFSQSQTRHACPGCPVSLRVFPLYLRLLGPTEYISTYHTHYSSTSPPAHSNPLPQALDAKCAACPAGSASTALAAGHVPKNALEGWGAAASGRRDGAGETGPINGSRATWTFPLTLIFAHRIDVALLRFPHRLLPQLPQFLANVQRTFGSTTQVVSIGLYKVHSYRQV